MARDVAGHQVGGQLHAAESAAEGAGEGPGEQEDRTGLPLTLRCLTVNRDARRFYERHGFAVSHDETIEFFGHDIDAWLMRKSAGAPR